MRTLSLVMTALMPLALAGPVAGQIGERGRGGNRDVEAGRRGGPEVGRPGRGSGAVIVPVPGADWRRGEEGRRDGRDRRDDDDWRRGDRDRGYDWGRDEDDRRRRECRDYDRRYDDRWDRRDGGHGWEEPYRRDRRDDECEEWRYRSDWTRTGISVRITFERDYRLLRLRLARIHDEWHHRHGWHARHPGWHRAHRALHERLEREYARFWRR